MVARYPSMVTGELRKGWSGPIEMSPDGQGMLGRLPLEGLFCAFGFSGAGMKIAPAVRRGAWGDGACGPKGRASSAQANGLGSGCHDNPAV